MSLPIPKFATCKSCGSFPVYLLKAPYGPKYEYSCKACFEIKSSEGFIIVKDKY